MKTLGEQWIENGRMYKAVEWSGEPCDGCCHQDISVYPHECLHHKGGCATQDDGLIAKDLGPVNEDGLLACPFCGEYPKIIHPTENMPVVSIMHTGVGHRILLEFFSSEQEAIDAWNRRT